jgi:hypothetical protein
MTKKTKLLARAAMTLLLAVLCSTGARAEEGKIIVWLNDGTTVPVLFSDMPEFTYADGMITLQSNSPSTALSWPIENLQKFTFEGISTTIRDVKATGLDIESDNMTVYDLSGRMVRQNVKSLSEFPKGVYIVKNGRVTIKVVRK